MTGLSPGARALVRAAKAREAPLPDSTRARVHQSVLRRAALAGTAAAASTAGMTAKAGVLGGGMVLPMLASTILGGLAEATLLVATRSMRRAPDIRSTPSVETTIAAVAVSPPPARIETPAPPHVPDVVSSRSRSESAPESPPAATAAARRPQPPPAPPAIAWTARPAEPALPAPAGAATSSEGIDDLTAQVVLLRRAHAAMRAGEPERALALLERNGVALGRGPLAEESGAARISALCQLGRASDAQSAIGAFLSAWPRSPLSLKVRGGCSALSGEKR